MKRTLAAVITSSAMIGSLLIAGVASAQTTSVSASASGHSWSGGNGHMGGMKPGVFGTVSAISGDTITVDSKGFGKTPTATTYSVDATGATVTKSGATSSLSSVAVGDMVMVEGTVSGTSVTATAIRDGVMPGMKGGRPGMGGMASSTLPQGNGQPVVGGSITAISGSTLTITNKSNVTYTVDASSATVNKSGQTSSLSNVAVGDNVVVQGAVNGNAVTASSIIDQGAPKTSTSTTAHAGFGGFIGGIGGFFQHLFGFF